jgi:hypothetical protein
MKTLRQQIQLNLQVSYEQLDQMSDAQVSDKADEFKEVLARSRDLMMDILRTDNDN